MKVAGFFAALVFALCLLAVSSTGRAELPADSEAEAVTCTAAEAVSCTPPPGCFDPDGFCSCLSSGNVPEWVCRWYACE